MCRKVVLLYSRYLAGGGRRSGSLPKGNTTYKKSSGLKAKYRNKLVARCIYPDNKVDPPTI